MNDMTHLEIKI